jgi:hypothetical protein
LETGNAVYAVKLSEISIENWRGFLLAEQRLSFLVFRAAFIAKQMAEPVICSIKAAIRSLFLF